MGVHCSKLQRILTDSTDQDFEFLFSEAKGNEPAVQSEETVGKYDNIGVIL